MTDIPGHRVTPQPVPGDDLIRLWERFQSEGTHLSVFAAERCVCWCGQRHPIEDSTPGALTVVWLSPEEKAKKALAAMREYVQRGEFDLNNLLEWMKQHGTSVLLNWSEGEDSDLWECSWITGGKRFTVHKKYIRSAVAGSFLKGTE